MGAYTNGNRFTEKFKIAIGYSTKANRSAIKIIRRGSGNIIARERGTDNLKFSDKPEFATAIAYMRLEWSQLKLPQKQSASIRLHSYLLGTMPRFTS